MARTTLKKLKPQQETFCQLYVNDVHCFGNGTRSYIIAYGETKVKYDSALRSASRLLTNVDIRRRIDELLDACLENKVVDRELARVILQNEDLPAKVSAIREYNRIRDRSKERFEADVTYRWMEPETI